MTTSEFLWELPIYLSFSVCVSGSISVAVTQKVVFVASVCSRWHCCAIPELRHFMSSEIIRGKGRERSVCVWGGSEARERKIEENVIRW